MVDQDKKIIEIQFKGFVTTIHFSEDGTLVVEDKPVK